MNSSLTACSPSQRWPGCKFQKQSPLLLWFWRWLTREQFSLGRSFSATTGVHSLSWGLTLPTPSVFQKTGPWLTLTPPIGCQSRSQAAAWHLKSHLLPKEQKVLGQSDAMGPPWGTRGGRGACPQEALQAAPHTPARRHPPGLLLSLCVWREQVRRLSGCLARAEGAGPGPQGLQLPHRMWPECAAASVHRRRGQGLTTTAPYAGSSKRELTL